MVDFKANKKEESVFIQKRNFSAEFFFKDYSHLISNSESLKNTMKTDIEYNKKIGYDVLTGKDIEKINFIPAFKDGLQNLTEKVLQGLALVFVSEFYEPFRVFDTEEMQNDFIKKQKESNISDYEIKDYLIKKGFYTAGRHFLDDWGHIQHINNEKRIAERDDEGEVVHLKDTRGKSYVRKMDVELYHFSIATLNNALENIIKSKTNNPKNSQIKKNEDNPKNQKI